MWFSAWLGALLRAQLFDFNNGNEDAADLVEPKKYGLENTGNFYFRSLDPRGAEDRMGAWVISPLERGSCSVEKESCTGGDLGVGRLSSQDTIFILLHGNGKNRGASHRIAAYKIFQSLGFYTLTLDYRGYGDSVMSLPLNATTVVEDAKAAIMLVRRSVGPDAKLVLYGHSMGTAIAAQAAAECQDQGFRVDGIILDSPFHSFKAALRLDTFVGSTLNYLLGLEDFIEEQHLDFDIPKYLARLTDTPVRIFHAVVDPVCPIEGARKIVSDMKAGGKDDIDLVVWEQEGLGHIGISKTAGFPGEIERFARQVHGVTKLGVSAGTRGA